MPDVVCGGWNETEKATHATQESCDQVKSQVEEKAGKHYEVYRAVEYREPTLAGKRLLIKVHVGGDSYDHLNVFQALPAFGGKTVLCAVEQNKTKDDPLEPFTD